MQAGDRLGRWRLQVRVTRADGIERWRAAAEDTGEPAEVLVPIATDAGARAAFLAVHRLLEGVREPGVVRTIEVRRDGVVRAPLEDTSLERVAAPLDAPTVAWIGARLLPATLAAGGAARAVLRAEDLVLDANGHPVLAPRGEVIGRLAPATTRAVAPESFDGAPPDGPAGLYGLGVVLYRLATGREPSTQGTRAGRAPPPPPSAVRHGIPPALDQAVLRLLSPDPSERAGALPLLQELAGPPVDLRAHARRAPAATEVVTTVSASTGTGARHDRDPAALVVLPTAELAALDPVGRNLAAGLARVPLAALDELAAAGLPLVVEATSGPAAARRRAAELARSTGLPVIAGSRAVLPAWVPAVIATLVATVPAVIGAAVLVFGVVPAAVALFVFAAIVQLVGILAGRGLAARQKLHVGGLAALDRARHALEERHAGGVLAPAWERLARLRVELARAELPAAAASDLRGALRDLEHQLEGLAKVAEAAESAVRQVDAAALRTRLQALNTRAATDAEARAERDRLARTVADLDAVDERRARVAADARVLLDGMAEMAALLGRVGDAPEEDVLVSLGSTARRVSEHLRDDDEVDRRIAARARSLERE